jgi:imidazoleglycerol-phosphate dehydratase
MSAIIIARRRLMATTETARAASVARKTNETDISVALSVDGTGTGSISTGVGFFDHMLEQLSRHSLIDMEIKAKGDLHIDDHHTVEDTGIAIGQALARALGRPQGHQPLCFAGSGHGRNADPCRHRHFRPAVSGLGRDLHGAEDRHIRHRTGARILPGAGPAWRHHLHVANLYGANNHHIAETCFKAVARVLRTACEVDPRQKDRIPSTKGSLA